LPEAIEIIARIDVVRSQLGDVQCNDVETVEVELEVADVARLKVFLRVSHTK
jgi:hypothetical protein